MKRLLLGLICLTVPLLPFLYIGAFLGPLRIPGYWFGFITVFYSVGILLVLADIVLSQKSPAFKIQWALLTVCLGLIFLPIYWFKYVFRTQPNASNARPEPTK